MSSPLTKNVPSTSGGTPSSNGSTGAIGPSDTAGPARGPAGVQPILAARGVVKRYGKVTAVRESDFDLFPGEVLAVLSEGNYVGEMGPFFGLPRSATVRAKTDCTVTGYTPRRFREVMGDRMPNTLGAAAGK